MSKIQSYVFINWTKQQSESWLKKHNIKYLKVDIVKKNGIISQRRYRHIEPTEFDKFRIKKIYSKSINKGGEIILVIGFNQDQK